MDENREPQHEPQEPQYVAPPEPIRVQPQQQRNTSASGGMATPEGLADMLGTSTGRPIKIRRPQRTQLAQAGLPQELVDNLIAAGKSGNGYMVAVWQLTEPANDDKPLPPYKVFRLQTAFPDALLLPAVKLVLQNILETYLGNTGSTIPTPSPTPSASEPEQ